MLPPVFSATRLAMLLLGGASGHIIMNSPAPYNLNMQPLLQVDPISGNTFPFPCHNQYGFTTRTPVEAGGVTLANFTGGGQHGGGSCQFSITYDEPAGGGGWNKSARFKTIYSIIGGCPAVFTDETRNLASVAVDKNMRQDSKHCGNDSGVDCMRQFMVPIPKFLKNGPATFAWTWFNKLGNKEMYMNCAPINITGGTGNEKEMEDLPDIFVANYPNDPEVPNCVTGTSADKVIVNFPNPGKYGLVLEAPVEPVNKPSNYCSQIPDARSLPVFESIPMANQETSPALSTPTLPGESSSTGTATEMRTSEFTSGTPSSVPRLSTTTPPMVLQTTLTTTVTEATSIRLGTACVNKPSDGAVACATQGELICLGESFFGLCNWGWAVPQRVAVGTKCEDGKVVAKRDNSDEERPNGYEWKGREPVQPVLVMEDENGMVWVPIGDGSLESQ
ncbi:hypothetical protein C7999DRAFT_12727 [Corynascus novoguineensis]|uniref:Lytic polysaccharide monooxygenase n=1 Tax=Corynascus novoguineensis TaxID=1126955 RepID=A0AAN7HL23_9PEZI|nr:hypothetical protein C7999DRAFT_12727 [Corynascus novoguineensis]